MQAVLAILIGVVAGISGGLFGIGGGIIIVPALAVAFGFHQHRAQGTSLVALLAPVGLFGLMEYHRRGEVDFRVGAFLAAGFFAGAYLGGRFAGNLNDEVMRKTFAVFLAVVAVYMFFKK